MYRSLIEFEKALAKPTRRAIVEKVLGDHGVKLETWQITAVDPEETDHTSADDSEPSPSEPTE